MPRRNKQAIYLAALLSGLLPAATGANPGSFSNPEQGATMSPDWIARDVQPAAHARQADLVVSLGQQTHPALAQVVKDYARDNQLNIVLEEGTCGISAGKLIRKSVDVGGFCCPPSTTDRLPGLEFHTLGIAAIALIAHPDNPLYNLSLPEARKVFGGQIRRWSGVSEARKLHPSFDQLVQPVGRLHCKVRPGHWHHLLKNEDLFSSRLYEVGVIPDMIAQVAQTPGAVGYETLFMTRHHQRSGNIKLLKLDGQHPGNLEYVRSGHYPFYRVYNLATWSGDSPRKQAARKLVTFLKDQISKTYKHYDIVPAAQLRQAGWRFRGDELVGEPVGEPVGATGKH